MKERVAIIGGGIAGLSAGYWLRHQYDVTVFEKQPRLGGNAYTYTSRDGQQVDIAVAAFGKAGYKNFYRLLDDLNVPTSLCAGSFMSFHDLDRNEGIYMSPTPKGLLAQHFRILRPGQLSAVLRVFRGLNDARQQLESGGFADQTVEQALSTIPSFQGDARTILLCVLCLLSSMSAAEVLSAPAQFFFKKLAVHHDVISPRAVYSVRAATRKTQSYIEALAFNLKTHVQTPVRAVRRHSRGVTLILEDGTVQEFEHVVLACNADQALALLENPTEHETQLLGVWKYKDGRVLVHRDHSCFPNRNLMQAYTFLYTVREGVLNTSVNGSLWHEPGVSRACDLISSQHPNFQIREDQIEFETTLRTPVFDFQSCATISKLPSLNGTLHTYYCGSHFGYGLHEDAVSSAVEVAKRLGVSPN